MTNNDYRTSIVPEAVAQIEEHELFSVQYQYADNKYMDVTDLKRNLVINPISNVNKLIAGEDSKRKDSAVIKYIDRENNEIVVDRVDQIILTGIHTVFYENGSPEKYPMPISTLIRECYNYKPKATIKEKEYQEFMERLYKLSNVYVLINFSQNTRKNNEVKKVFIDPETGYSMDSLKGRLIDFEEVTNKESSSKDWIILEQPKDYEYSLNKKQFARVNKELFVPTNKRNTEQYRILNNFIMDRLVRQRRSYHKNGDSKYQPKILWETLFKECQLQDKSPTQKTRIREDVENIFLELKEKGFIESFEPYGPRKRPKGIIYELNFDYQLQV